MPDLSFSRGVVFVGGGGGGGGAAAATALAAKKAAEAAKAKAAADAKAAAEAAAEAAAREKARLEAEAAAKAKAEADAAIAQAKTNADNTAKLQSQVLADPSSMVTETEVAQINLKQPGTNIDSTAGQVTGAVPQVDDPAALSAAIVTPETVTNKVKGITDATQAVQGTVSADATVEAATMTPDDLSALDLQATQLAEAQKVAVVPPRAVQPGEMISGSAVDMAKVNEALDIQAMVADPTTQATVKGQLDGLMADFEGGAPPAWAAGALRNATAQMAARGLGASSMAGQALVQAAMESALPIAMADAQTFAKFESQNLSNRQQTAMFAAEQRANFLGMEFTQEFQTRVSNAAKISDVANMNFTADQQVALENARMAQTVDITNLNAMNAKMMADAAAMSQLDMQNLNNRQQAAVTNAQSFLAMDMKNMDFAQQTELFKSQSVINAVLSDQAAVNAAKQFNASSENQTNQFFESMKNQVQQFNAGMVVQRDQFNAQNALVVAQANAQWRQNATTLNTAAQNEANMADAMAANNFTQSTMDVVWQRERDMMDYAFRMSESSTDRALSVFLADKQVDLAEWQSSQASRDSTKTAVGFAVGKLVGL
tara:strand:- start:4565 stop:6370 length:1806 start_codon:yes stop_codon:yes gene_type:complete